jgi:hypothetical protein
LTPFNPALWFKQSMLENPWAHLQQTPSHDKDIAITTTTT